MKQSKFIIPEREVQKSGIKILESLGWKVWRRNVGAMEGTHNGKTRFMRFCEPGQSDTWGVLPDGRHVEIEFKRLGQKPTAAQIEWLKMMNGCRCVAFWVDNVDTLVTVAQAINRGYRIIYRYDCSYRLEAEVCIP